MACYCNNVELLLGEVDQQPADSLGSLVPIHEGHHAVGENERVPVGVSFVDSFLDMFNELFSVVAAVNSGLNILHS